MSGDENRDHRFIALSMKYDFHVEINIRQMVLRVVSILVNQK